MKTIGIQFHAEPLEIINFINKLISKYDLKTILMIFRPFKLAFLEKNDVESAYLEYKDKGKIRFSLSKDNFILDCKTKNEFLDKNPNIFSFDVGRLLGNNLEESFFSVKTDNENFYNISKEISKELKKLTQSGVTAINPDSGAKSYIRSNRYTIEAENLLAKGIKMLPAAGKSLIVFGRK